MVELRGEPSDLDPGRAGEALRRRMWRRCDGVGKGEWQWRDEVMGGREDGSNRIMRVSGGWGCEIGAGHRFKGWKQAEITNSILGPAKPAGIWN